jgi:peptide deformylase
LRGRAIEREATGFHAVVVQHECDHLIGRLYPTRMTDLTQLGYTEVLFPGLAAADDD